jgi:hypothetical protein
MPAVPDAPLPIVRYARTLRRTVDRGLYLPPD